MLYRVIIIIISVLICISFSACHQSNQNEKSITSENPVKKEIIDKWIGSGQPLKYPGKCLSNFASIENRVYKCITIGKEDNCECLVLAGEWNGDIYSLDGYPDFAKINSHLDRIKSAIIAKGISEKYFKEHLDLIEVKSDYSDYSKLSVSYAININEYHTPLYAEAEPVYLNYDHLHDIESTLPRIVVEGILIGCLGTRNHPQLSLTEMGELVLRDSSDKYCASVNLETGACKKWYCGPRAF